MSAPARAVLKAVERINAAIRAGVPEKTVEELMNPEAQLPEVYPSAADLYQRELASLQQQSPEVARTPHRRNTPAIAAPLAWSTGSRTDCAVAQLTLSHPELLVAVEMLSSVVLMNQAMEAGDRAALWRQLSSPVTGLSNVEESYAQR